MEIPADEVKSVGVVSASIQRVLEDKVVRCMQNDTMAWERGPCNSCVYKANDEVKKMVSGMGPIC